MIKHLKKNIKILKLVLPYTIILLNEKFYKDYIQSKFITFYIIRNSIERLI